MIVAGIDEVGRGSLAGPLVAAAVILDRKIAGLTDSKLLSKSKREGLAAQIQSTAQAFGVGWVDAREIDEVGLTQAVRLAMQRALAQIGTNYDIIVIDGNYNFLSDIPSTRCVIKADLSEPAVSAASIVAKVSRDRFMIKQASQHPNWGFETNVGYGTSFHMKMLNKYGLSDLHRKSFAPIKQLGLNH